MILMNIYKIERITGEKDARKQKRLIRRALRKIRHRIYFAAIRGEKSFSYYCDCDMEYKSKEYVAKQFYDSGFRVTFSRYSSFIDIYWGE